MASRIQDFHLALWVGDQFVADRRPVRLRLTHFASVGPTFVNGIECAPRDSNPKPAD